MKEQDPKIDESLLTPAQLEELHRKKPLLPWIIVFSAFLVIIVILVIVILSLPAPVEG